MFKSCMYCHRRLGGNEVVESFPVGRRLAFDGARGRLWVVCRRCERWNLTPLEERWEAVEDCERIFRDTRVRVSTENIGLARHPEGRRRGQPDPEPRQPVTLRADDGQASPRRRRGDQAEPPGRAGNPAAPVRRRSGVQGPGSQGKEGNVARGRRGPPLRRHHSAQDQRHGRFPGDGAGRREADRDRRAPRAIPVEDRRAGQLPGQWRPRPRQQDAETDAARPRDGAARGAGAAGPGRRTLAPGARLEGGGGNRGDRRRPPAAGGRGGIHPRGSSGGPAASGTEATSPWCSTTSSTPATHSWAIS